MDTELRPWCQELVLVTTSRRWWLRPTQFKHRRIIIMATAMELFHRTRAAGLLRCTKRSNVCSSCITFRRRSTDTNSMNTGRQWVLLVPLLLLWLVLRKTLSLSPCNFYIHRSHWTQIANLLQIRAGHDQVVRKFLGWICAVWETRGESRSSTRTQTPCGSSDCGGCSFRVRGLCSLWTSSGSQSPQSRSRFETSWASWSSSAWPSSPPWPPLTKKKKVSEPSLAQWGYPTWTQTNDFCSPKNNIQNSSRASCSLWHMQLWYIYICVCVHLKTNLNVL